MSPLPSHTERRTSATETSGEDTSGQPVKIQPARRSTPIPQQRGAHTPRPTASQTANAAAQQAADEEATRRTAALLLAQKAAEADIAADAREQQATPSPVTIQPAAAWPQFTESVAKTEMAAMELLSRGVHESRVKQMTKLPTRRVRELATLCAEEAANPVVPRIAGGRPQLRATASRRRPATRAAEPEQMTFFLA